MCPYGTMAADMCPYGTVAARSISHDDSGERFALLSECPDWSLTTLNINSRLCSRLLCSRVLQPSS